MKFKRFLLAACLMFAFSLPSRSFGDDGPKAIFEKGNAAYAKGRYNDAIADYQQLVSDGYESAAVFFNMGNAYYKNGDVPSAILYYEKAHKLAPGDDDINFNLKYANLKTTDRMDEVPEFFLGRWWRDVILISSADNLAIWSIVFVFLGSGVLVFYFFAGSVNLKKGAFYASALLFFFGLAMLFMAGSQTSYFKSHHEAIVFSGAVDVKSSPANQATTLFVIHQGTKVNTLETTNGWMKISLANGNLGWIKPGDVKEI